MVASRRRDANSCAVDLFETIIKWLIDPAPDHQYAELSTTTNSTDSKKRQERHRDCEGSSPRFKNSDRQSGIINREHPGERASNSSLDSCRLFVQVIQAVLPKGAPQR
ncbi:hypothetical protein Q8A67_011273 [Cirrhinus molitorella]|uniref:Uncharacterized protein n=1 Tax=Cirrhinus molitorella TaxID=172907 RepID=A0AA88PQC7_9TELE|nr:hypothetical protein Q8A67_011273 [Cirrhinus molitorella]